MVIAASAVIAVSAHWIVDSACRVGSRLGVSATAMGLTVVALGTSAPEFAVTILASLEGRGDISVANILGSNIFNLGFILGGVALIRPIPIGRAMIGRDGSVLVAATVLVFILVAFDLELSRGDGLVLCASLLAYSWALHKYEKPTVSRRGDAVLYSLSVEPSRTLLVGGAQLVAGLIILGASAHVLVSSASGLAVSFGVSEWVVGVTIVAAGTSVPEFATAMAGVFRRQYGLSLGNIIGSDLFNMLGVLGLAGILREMQVDEAARVSLGALSLMALAAVIFMRSGWRLSRSEGFILVAFALLRWGFDLNG